MGGGEGDREEMRAVKHTWPSLSPPDGEGGGAPDSSRPFTRMHTNGGGLEDKSHRAQKDEIQIRHSGRVLPIKSFQPATPKSDPDFPAVVTA